MKRVMILCVAVLLGGAFTACEKDDKGQLDPTAMVALNGVPVKSELPANAARLTPLEVVKLADGITFWNKAIQHDHAIGRGFDVGQRDIENVRLLMFGTDIITQFGEYSPEFIEGEDVILTRVTPQGIPIDTVAYVPNKTISDAQKIIKAAFDAGDYNTVYLEFNRAFTFIPITGAEWLALKAEGKN